MFWVGVGEVNYVWVNFVWCFVVFVWFGLGCGYVGGLFCCVSDGWIVDCYLCLVGYLGEWLGC